MSMRVWAFFALLLLLCIPHDVRADDYGSRADVRALRGDTRILLLARLRSLSVSAASVTVDDVVVIGNDALVRWHAQNASGIEGLERIYDRWWEMLRGPSLPTADTLNQLGWPSELLPLATTHFNAPSSTSTQTPATPDAPMPMTCASEITTAMSTAGATVDLPATSTTDGYAMCIALARNDGPGDRFAIGVRRPSRAESWMVPSGNSYVFFTMTLFGPTTLHVASGTAIDLWFPYVLDDTLRYSLTVAHADAPLGPITGTLHDNILHFVLPAFIVTPGTTLMAEVESP